MIDSRPVTPQNKPMPHTLIANLRAARRKARHSRADSSEFQAYLEAVEVLRAFEQDQSNTTVHRALAAAELRAVYTPASRLSR